MKIIRVLIASAFIVAATSTHAQTVLTMNSWLPPTHPHGREAVYALD